MEYKRELYEQPVRGGPFRLGPGPDLDTKTPGVRVAFAVVVGLQMLCVMGVAWLDDASLLGIFRWDLGPLKRGAVSERDFEDFYLETKADFIVNFEDLEIHHF